MEHVSRPKVVAFFAPRLHNNQRGWLSVLIESGDRVVFVDFGAGVSEDVAGVEVVTARRSVLSRALLTFSRFTRGRHQPDEDLLRTTFLPSIIWLSGFLLRRDIDVLVTRDRTRSSYITLLMARLFRVPSLMIYEQIPVGSRNHTSPQISNAAKEDGKSLRDWILRTTGLSSIVSISPLASTEVLVDTISPSSRANSENRFFVPFLVPGQGQRRSDSYCPGGIVRVISIGKFRAYKNLGLLVTIFESLSSEQRTSITLTVVGQEMSQAETAQRQTLGEELSKIEDLEVTLLSNLTHADVQKLLRDSDILLFPSSHDLAPIVPLEAMASGVVPLISSNAGTASYVSAWSEELVLDPSRPKVWVSKLSSLIHDPSDIARLGQKAQAKAALLLNNPTEFLNAFWVAAESSRRES